MYFRPCQDSLTIVWSTWRLTPYWIRNVRFVIFPIVLVDPRMEGPILFTNSVFPFYFPRFLPFDVNLWSSNSFIFEIGLIFWKKCWNSGNDFPLKNNFSVTLVFEDLFT